MTEKDGNAESKIDKHRSKAPYNSPQLVMYGNIREMTLNAQKAPAPDNKGQDMNMTG
jgi:hypothetical protein